MSVAPDGIKLSEVIKILRSFRGLLLHMKGRV
jgi:hypothetical protein